MSRSRIAGTRHRLAPCRRALHEHGQDRHRARALPRLRPGADRSPGWTDPAHLRDFGFRERTLEGREAPRRCRHEREALLDAARCPDLGSPGRGTGSHLAGELFTSMARTDIVHVPYRGSAPALTDLLGGQIQLIFATSVSVSAHLKAGKLRGVAVTSAKRSSMLPDVPISDRRDAAPARTLPASSSRAWPGPTSCTCLTAAPPRR